MDFYVTSNSSRFQGSPAKTPRIITSATREERLAYKADLRRIGNYLVFDHSLAFHEAYAKWPGWIPSKCSVGMGISVIRVDNPKQPWVEKDKELMAKMDEEFQYLVGEGQVTGAQIRKLATKYGYVGGKWQLYCEWIEADKIWPKLVMALLARRLPSAMGLKSTVRDKRGDSLKEYRKQCMIEIVTRDFGDQEEVFRAAEEVMRLGMGIVMKYRPTIYSRLGVFAFRGLNIAPTLYTCYPDQGPRVAVPAERAITF